ncbi:MAG: hypothetical protein A2X48_17305 [Lentisphaerae bacterium GWF2_49_21]|nr:MAG: hypothetical protein A2X48_17305 [Lentisphaerae bacterium GWF2_49_21]
MKLLRLLGISLIITICGCVSEYQYSKAVAKARAYTIEKMPELSEKARHCVRFTPPRMLTSLLISEAARPKQESKKDFIQTCMVWPLADQEGMYIVVAGVSERRLDDWNPTRVLIKKFDELPKEAKTDDRNNQ